MLRLAALRPWPMMAALAAAAACAPLSEAPRRGLSAPVFAPLAEPPPQPAAPPAAEPRPRWQAVPAVADGEPVPGGRRHRVKEGETGLAIARAYGVPWRRIADANKIREDSILRVGQALFVPLGPPGGQSSSPYAAARAFSIDLDELEVAARPAESAGRASLPVARSAPAPRPPVRQALPAPPPAAAPPPPRPTGAVPQLAWPVDGRVILSRFGRQPDGSVNEGINIRGARGAAVRAAAPGEILYAGDAIRGFGLLVVIRHSPSLVTVYAHLDDIAVARGERVDRGGIVGRVGSTGAVAEPQLLFQVRRDRRAVDPLTLLPA